VFALCVVRPHDDTAVQRGMVPSVSEDHVRRNAGWAARTPVCAAEALTAPETSAFASRRPCC